MAKNKKGFCEHCHSEITMSLKNTTLEGEFRGNHYQYEGIQPLAPCGHPVNDQEIEAQNRQSLSDTYRLENCIIPLEHIRALPQKYDIGKRPLSQLLQWGELTFTRYYDGDTPSKAYSTILSDIYQSPEIYLTLLEKNRSFISEKAYKKSKAAAEHSLQHNNKLGQVVQYLFRKDPDLSPNGLQSLLYYCQGFYYGIFQTALFPEEPMISDSALFYPFSPEICHQSQCLQQGEPEFTQGEIQLMDMIYNEFGIFSGSFLSQAIFKELPILQARASLPSHSTEQITLSRDLMYPFFTQVTKDYYGLQGIHHYSTEIYKLR